MKRVFIAMAMTLIVRSQMMAYDFTIDGISYNVVSPKDLTCEVTTSDKKYEGDIVIPENVTYQGKSLSVIAIDDYAFSGCKSLSSISIPTTVTEIGNYAFNGCSSLSYVQLSQNVNSIGEGGFYGCSSLQEISFPCTIDRISDKTFYGCSALQSFVIPSSVTTIGKCAFYGCTSLSSISIPINVETLGAQAFYGCSTLSEVKINSKLTIIENETFKGCTSLKELHIPNNITNIKYEAFRGCTALSNIVIGNGLETLGRLAFYECSSLMAFDVDKDNVSFSSVDGVLYDKSKTTLLCYPCRKSDVTLYIKDNVNEISSYAFSGCSNIRSIVIEDSDNKLKMGYNLSHTDEGAHYPGQGIFYDCPLTCVYLGRDLEYDEGNFNVGASPFYGVESLKSIQIGSNVTRLGDYLFSEINVDSVFIPKTVLQFGKHVFEGLRSICIEDGTQTLELAESYDSRDFGVGGGQFHYCSLEYAYIGRNLEYNSSKRYGYSPFAKIKQLKYVVVGESVTSLQSHLFYNCASLDSITIGSGVNWIGNKAFEGCDSLSLLSMKGETPPEACSDSYTTVQYMNTTVIVPNGCIDMYKTADVWSNFWNIQSNTNSAIQEVITDDSCIKVEGNKVIITDMRQLPVSVYNINGFLIYKGYSNIVNLPQYGMYIIKTSNNVYKIVYNK